MDAAWIRDARRDGWYGLEDGDDMRGYLSRRPDEAQRCYYCDHPILGTRAARKFGVSPDEGAATILDGHAACQDCVEGADAADADDCASGRDYLETGMDWCD